MQVNHDALFSATTDLSTLTYLGVLLCKMTTAQVEALAAKPNRKDTKGAVPYMVLRAAIAKKLAEGDWKTAFAAGTLQVETPAEKAAKAANAQAEAQAKAANAQAGAEASGPWQQAEAEEAEATGSTGPQAESKASTESKGKGRPRNILTGAYHVAKRPGTKSTEASDPAKWEIWQHIWGCRTFEEFYKNAPEKASRSSGKPITRQSELNWALKQGWIVPGEKQAA